MDGKYFAYGDKELLVIPDTKHDWLMDTRDVAKGYGVIITTIRGHKKNHRD